MSRFGVKTLLYYYIYPKQSKYILVSCSSYYHPYRHERAGDCIHTRTQIADITYESARTHGGRKIMVKIQHNMIQYYSIGKDNSMHIAIWVGNRYYAIQMSYHGFTMFPPVDKLAACVNLLKPVSIYDLYCQSIVWLLKFIQ